LYFSDYVGKWMFVGDATLAMEPFQNTYGWGTATTQADGNCLYWSIYKCLWNTFDIASLKAKFGLGPNRALAKESACSQMRRWVSDGLNAIEGTGFWKTTRQTLVINAFDEDAPDIARTNAKDLWDGYRKEVLDAKMFGSWLQKDDPVDEKE
jgi:hypothetical protein